MVFYLIIGAFITITLLLLLYIPYFFVLFIENSICNDINEDIKEIKRNMK